MCHLNLSIQVTDKILKFPNSISFRFSSTYINPVLKCSFVQKEDCSGVLGQPGCLPSNAYLLLDPFKTHSCAGRSAEHIVVYGSSSNDNWNQGEKLILIAEPEEEMYP